MIGKNETGVGNIGRDDISILTVDCYNKRKAKNQLENGKYYYTVHEGATIVDLSDFTDLDVSNDYTDYYSQLPPALSYTITHKEPSDGTATIDIIPLFTTKGYYMYSFKIYDTTLYRINIDIPGATFVVTDAYGNNNTWLDVGTLTNPQGQFGYENLSSKNNLVEGYIIKEI
jgi:hypothetical protein